MLRFLTVDEMVTMIGLEEMLQLAGIGHKRSDEGRSLDQSKVEEAISFADDLIIAKLRERYRTIEDLSPGQTPPLLKGYACDIARYRLRVRVGNQSQVSQDLKDRYDEAISFLKDLQRGLSSIDIPGDPRGKETRALGMMAASPPNRSSEILKGYLR